MEQYASTTYLLRYFLNSEVVPAATTRTPAEPGDEPLPIGAAPVDGNIEIKGLSFRYADSDPLVFKDLPNGALR